jgi:hypothetical protein
VVKTGMSGPGIYPFAHSQLTDSAQTLEIGMLHNIVNQSAGQGHKSVQRIID